jgi:hypothetical protein
MHAHHSLCLSPYLCCCQSACVPTQLPTCRYRSKHNTPALAWDAKLAAAAQAWADSCPWTSSDLPYGENMAFGYDSFGDALDAWYSEVSE